MTKMMKFAFLTAGLALVLGLCIQAPALAHESRTVGPKGEYTLVIGWFIEPAFVEVVNAVDIRVIRSADKKPVNTAKGDIVDLEVEVQYRSGEDEKASVVSSLTLPGKPEITFGTENRYASWFKPVRSGAYAFRIKGKIEDASNRTAGPITIDELFVCGKGTKGHHSFVCLEEPLVFPAAPAAKAKTK